MKRPVGRRAVLAGAGAAVAAVAAGAGALWLVPTAATSDGDDYVKLLAEVRDDYANGRVVEHNGWVLSQHEFDTIASRAGQKGAG